MRNLETTSKGRCGNAPRLTQCGGVFLRGLTAIFIALALMALVPLASAQSGPVVWVVPSLQRVGPDDSAGSGTQAQLSAARGEYESFQIVVKAPSSSALSNVNVSVSDLTGPGGQMIARQNLSLFREQYVNVTTSSPNWGGANQPLPKGWYPDGLIPFVDPSTGQPPSGSATLKAVPFSLSASKNQPIWVDVFVPRGAAAGYYTGSFTVTSDQGSVTGQINLSVWNFTLPLKPSLKSSFLFWSAGNLAAIQELLRNRINPERVPTANQRSLIDNLGLTSQETGYWSGADISTCTMSAAPSVTSLRNTVAAQQPDLFLYNYTADEIDQCSGLYPTMKQWGYNLHQAGINNLVTMAPVPDLFDDGSGTGRSAVDIWVMLPVTYDHSVNNVKTAQAKGDEAWSYNCLVQDAYSPKWMIDFAPINFRIQPGFINESLGLNGLLYWRLDLWSSDPWNNVYTSGFPNYPGEGMLVYPGSTVGISGVAPSMRLKWLRDGVEDYEYIELLKQAGQGSWALQVAAGVGANWSNWTKDINVLANARQQLGQQLDTLGGGSSNLPSTPGNPSPQNAATGVSLTPTLSWAAASAASSYDVYFGTSSSPAMAGNTSGTSYNPGTLSASTTYYWRVVAKNSAGSTSSATWSFTTAAASSGGPAAPVSVTPSSGSGLTQTFAFTFSVPNGLTTANVLINTATSGLNSCWFNYNSPANSLSLASDDTSAWSSATVGSQTTLQNSQCSIPANGVTVSAAAPNVTLTVPVTFNTAFAGQKNVYMRVQDQGGTLTSFVAMGTWTVQQATPAPGTPANPSPGNGATGVSTSSTLAWSAASDATSYDVYLGTSPSPAMAGSTSGTSYNRGTLSANTTYYWRVVAKNLAGSNVLGHMVVHDPAAGSRGSGESVPWQRRERSLDEHFPGVVRREQRYIL